ncbi:hypothetical protein [Botrimarina mediterranea]|uniref:Uncharacterized protein n=1 Tax=Botrimarina mediterranea TaxID=2528022 RepID=A0A518KA22_9BACT|nr:hypothetical protein [Botrimarina mediterranea]QDV74639.1 hypothetical protein Spa11_28450 [Botrimarina mediterranea]
MLIVIGLVALVLAVDQRARQIERAQHYDGYFFVIVRSQQGMNTMQVRCSRFRDLHELTASTEPWAGLKNNGIDRHADWPPKVWLTRTDWSAATREKAIDIACGGTFDEPEYSDNPQLKIGDRLFFDFVAGGHKQ